MTKSKGHPASYVPDGEVEIHLSGEWVPAVYVKDLREIVAGNKHAVFALGRPRRDLVMDGRRIRPRTPKATATGSVARLAAAMIKTPAEQAFQAELRASAGRVASATGVPRENVSVHFENFSGHDGDDGEAWSFHVVIPPRDKRRNVSHVSGMGDSIAEAETAVVHDYEMHLRVEELDAAAAARKRERKRKA